MVAYLKVLAKKKPRIRKKSGRAGGLQNAQTLEMERPAVLGVAPNRPAGLEKFNCLRD